MDFLTDWLTNWLKELLIGGIMGNLEGLFDTVNLYKFIQNFFICITLYFLLADFVL